VGNTGRAIAHTLLEHGTGSVDQLNAKAKEQAVIAEKFNIDQLAEKYKTDFAEYQKAHPTGTFEEFLLADPARAAELKNIQDGLAYLKEGVTFIDADFDAKKHENFTYSKDGRWRLSVDDDVLRALYGATQDPIGKNEKLLSSDISAVPSQISENQAQAALTRANIPLVKEKINTEKAKQRNYDERTNKLRTTPTTITNLPRSRVLQIGREAKVMKGTSGHQFIIEGGAVPAPLRKIGGMDVEAAIKLIPKPGTNAGTSEKKAYEAKVAALKGRRTYQMRFFNKANKDVTEDQWQEWKNSPTNPTPEELLELHLIDGGIVKFIDQEGNIVSTSETIDLATQIENNKTNSDKEEPLGQNLSVEEED
jgi:hypothetical protein